MRGLLNNLSTFEIVFLIVGGAVVLSIIGVRVAESLYPSLGEGSFSEGSDAIKGTFTLLFGLILALTISGLSSNSGTAASAVSDEATALAQITRGSAALPRRERTRLRAAVEQYVHAVAEDEFATMRAGQQSPLAAAALANLYGVTGQSSAYSPVAGKVDQLTKIRRDRLQIAGASLSSLLRIMLFLGTVLFVILAYPAKIKKRSTRLAVVGGIAAFVTFVFVLTIVLDYPFSGDLATSNQPYKENALATYWPGI